MKTTKSLKPPTFRARIMQNLMQDESVPVPFETGCLLAGQFDPSKTYLEDYVT